MKFVVNILCFIFILITISCSSSESSSDYNESELVKIDSVLSSKLSANSQLQSKYEININGCIPIVPKFEISVVAFELLDTNKQIVPAKPIAGENALALKIVYPELAKRAEIEGNVLCEFKVDENGNSDNVKILKDIGGGCGEQVYNAILKSKFIPGMLGKNKFVSNYRIVIQFKIIPVNK